MTANDEDKIKNYFKYIINEFEKRKELLQDYNGDYYNYIKKTNKALPIILTIINNFENFTELFQDKYSDILNKVSREAEKYGMLFIITVNNTNGINYRLSQNFKQMICLKMKDVYDYKGILGNNVSVIPANFKGRGIINVNGEAYEFQTADPIETNDLNEYIINTSNQLYEKQQGKALSIKTLPTTVDYNFIKDYYNDLNDFPIGVETESLEICKYNFLDNYFNLIIANDSEIIVPFIKSIVYLISEKRETQKVIIFDGDKYFSSVKENVTYLDDKFEAGIKSFNAFLDNVDEKTKKTIVIFTGLNKILSSINTTNILNVIFEKINKIEKINVIICDSINDINKYISDINQFISKDNGIFLGSGIDSQYLIDIKKISMDMRSEIPDNYGYLIRKKKAIKIKTIELNEDVDV